MASSPSECNIKVMCRFRPLNESEMKIASSFTPRFLNDSCCVVEEKPYAFDRVFQTSVNQQSIYEATAKPLVGNVLSGYNGTIFAYGQTSSGKTFTMEGVVGDRTFEGIIPRCVNDIFEQISAADPASVRFTIKVSYFEIYLEKIRDLLDTSKRDLEIREDRNRVPYVKGCTERTVSNISEMMAAIEDGKAAKAIDATKMNERSSRSHSVCLIKILQEQTATQKKLNGNLCLVDLAGSEKVSKTGAEGKRLEEAKKINRSLSALRKTIFSLANGEAFIPYRESKLTRVLQDSLGGNSKTTIIICCSPASYNLEETKSTLQFGVSAKTIKNVVRINEELTVEEWKRLVDKERTLVQKKDHIIAAAFHELSRWRNGEFVPRGDQLDAENFVHTGTPAKAPSFMRTPRAANDNNKPAMDDLDESVDENDEQEETEKQQLDKVDIESTANYVAEKAVWLTKVAEAECEKDLLMGRLDDVKEQLKTALENLEGSATDEPIMNPALDILRSIGHKLDGIRNGECTLDEGDLDLEKDEDDDADDPMQVTSRQEGINREMEKLLHQIKDKEMLICRSVANAESIEKMRFQHEAEMKELREKIDTLQRERAEIMQVASKNTNANKVSETRRVRLQEVEKQLAECRRKVQDLTKFEKVKADNEKTIKTLRTEVDSMKATRVKLMRQMREDNERYRRGQTKVEHEMRQLQEQGKRRQFEIEKAKMNMDKQLTVYRRKYDEAVAANKRLQQRMEKQNSVRRDRFADQQDNARLNQEIKAYLNDEVGLQVSVEEAKLFQEQLQTQLEDLNRDRRKLETERKKWQKQTKSILATDVANARTELDRVELELTSLNEETERRQTQMEQLQKRVESYDGKSKEAIRWANIHTIVAAKCAMKIMFDLLVQTNVEKLMADHRVSDAQAKVDDLQLNLARLEKTLRDSERQFELMSRQYEDDSCQKQHDYQVHIGYLLQQLQKVNSGIRLDDEEMERMIDIWNKVEDAGSLGEKLLQMKKENKRLEEELSRANVRSATGTRKFFGHHAVSTIPESPGPDVAPKNLVTDLMDCESTPMGANNLDQTYNVDLTETVERVPKRARRSSRHEPAPPELLNITTEQRSRRQTNYAREGYVNTLEAIDSPSDCKPRTLARKASRSTMPKLPKGCRCKSGECEDDCVCRVKQAKCSAQCSCIIMDKCDNYSDTSSDESKNLCKLMATKTEHGASAGQSSRMDVGATNELKPDAVTFFKDRSSMRARSPKKFFQPPSTSKKPREEDP